jgi:hypothetical protein
MSSSVPPAGPFLRLAIFLAAFVGVLLLVLIASCVRIHPTMHVGPAIPVLAFTVCGTVSLASSWLLYRRHNYALPVYCASWMLNITGWVALKLSSRSDPLWFIVFYAFGILCLAAVLIFRLRKELAQRAIAV